MDLYIPTLSLPAATPPHPPTHTWICTFPPSHSPLPPHPTHPPTHGFVHSHPLTAAQLLQLPLKSHHLILTAVAGATCRLAITQQPALAAHLGAARAGRGGAGWGRGRGGVGGLNMGLLLAVLTCS
jgi:hypothetical protein